MNILYILIGGLITYYIYSMPKPLIANEKSFTLYHWVSCGHCKVFLPTYNALGSSYNGITIRQVERSQNNEYSVSGFPTMVYRDGKGGIEEYDGARDINSLKSYLASK